MSCSHRKGKKGKLATNANPARIDPTRSAALRKKFEQQISGQFARLKAVLFKHLIDDDALELSTKRKGVQLNSFCPTGEGGGIDPTCGKGGGSKLTPSDPSGGGTGWLHLDSGDFQKNNDYEHEAVMEKITGRKVEFASDKTQTQQAILRGDYARMSLDHPTQHIETNEANVAKVLAWAKKNLDPVKVPKLLISVYRQGRVSPVREVERDLVTNRQREKFRDLKGNAFCPTGKGGGVDPTCGKGGLARIPDATVRQDIAQLSTISKRPGGQYYAGGRSPFAASDTPTVLQPKKSKAKVEIKEQGITEQIAQERARWHLEQAKSHEASAAHAKDGDMVGPISTKAYYTGLAEMEMRKHKLFKDTADDMQALKTLVPKLGLAKDVDSIADLVGAPDDATIQVAKVNTTRSKTGWQKELDITIYGRGFSASRTAILENDGTKVMHNNSFFIHGGQGKGMGTTILAAQVANLRAQKYDRIDTWAARGPGMNGYYTWARLGYDQKISEFRDKRTRDKIRKAYPEAKSIQDIMATPEGRAWWKKNGTNMRKAKFDLKDGSRSLRVMEAYLSERAARPTANSLWVLNYLPSENPEPNEDDEVFPMLEEAEEIELDWDDLPTENAFCATGVGGGVNPTCGKGDSKPSHEHKPQTPEQVLGKAGKVGKWMKGKTKAVYAKMEARYGKKGAAAIFASGQALSWGAFAAGGAMGTVIYLPSAVAMLPGAAIAEVRRAMGRKKTDNVLTVNDLLHPDLSEEEVERLGALLVKAITLLYVNRPAEMTDNAADWRFSPNPEKIAAFQDWLKKQLARFLINKTNEELWRLYVEQGFKKGAARSFDDSKAVERSIETSLDFYQGTKYQFLRDSFRHAESVGKVKILAGRSFDELKNITADMSNRISRTLTDGLVQGKNPRAIARDLVKDVDIGKKRAVVIARTEIIRAHASGQLQALADLGVEQVGVAVEWSVTKLRDGTIEENVCALCRPLDGMILTLAEAEGMLPRHPQCRCAWIPANVGEGASGQKRAYPTITKAIRSSQKKARKDGWKPNRPISKVRPQKVVNHLGILSQLIKRGSLPLNSGS